jgi:hypothetical protein
MLIDGYSPSEWCDDENLVLVIETTDSDGNITNEIRFKNHYQKGEPAWPPLEPNGDNWHID